MRTCRKIGFVFLGLLVAPLSAWAHAQSGQGPVVLRGVPPNVSVMFEINGTKPPGGDTVSSADGVAQMVLDYMAASKPEGFKAQVYVDVCRSGVKVRVQVDGAAPPSADDCTRHGLGTIEFRADATVSLAVSPRLRPLPAATVTGGFGTDASPMNFTANRETWGARSGTTSLGTETNDTVPPGQKSEAGLTAATTLLAVPVNVLGGSSSRNRVWWMAEDTAGGGPARQISHHALVGFGRGEAELDYIITDGSGPNVRWKGSSPIWSLGYSGAIELCGGCRWFANPSYVFSRLLSANMERTRALDLDGGTLIRDDATYDWNAHAASFTIGRATSHVFPYAGARVVRRSASLEGSLDVDFSAVVGGPFVQSVSFVNEFRKTSAQAVFGAQIRIPNTRLLVRAEGAAGAGASGFGVNFGYGWF